MHVIVATMQSTPQHVLAERIRSARTELGWSQSELAQHSDLPQSQISKIESAAVQDPSFFTVRRLAQSLGIPFSQLGYSSSAVALAPQRAQLADVGHPMADQDHYALGHVDTPDGVREILGSVSALDKHMLIYGQAGTGKSVLMRELAVGIANSGASMVFIEPVKDYDMARTIMRFCPQRAQDIVRLDVSSEQFAYNPLDIASVGELPMAVSFIIRAIEGVHPMGEVTRNHLAKALSALCEANLKLTEYKCTLLHLGTFLNDSRFRQLVLDLVEHPHTLSFYHPDHGPYEALSQREQREQVRPIIQVLQQFVNDPITSSILKHGHGRIDWIDMLGNGKIVIMSGGSHVNRPNQTIMLRMLLEQMITTSHRWGRRRDPETREIIGMPVRLLIDEAHMIVKKESDPLITILAEARKYDLGVVVASQFPEQFDTNVQKALWGNTASKMILALSASSQAAQAAQAVSAGTGQITTDMVTMLPAYHAYANIMSRSQLGEQYRTGPFLVRLRNEYELGHEDYQIELDASTFEHPAEAPQQGRYIDALRNEMATKSPERFPWDTHSEPDWEW